MLIHLDMLMHLVTDRWPSYMQWVPQLFKSLEFFPLNPVVEKSCKIEYCGNKTHQTIQNYDTDLRFRT